METLKIGEDVYWIQKTKTREIERVGKIIGIVQPECSPNRIIPGFIRDTVSLRNFTTYLIRVYGSNAIFWPTTVTRLPESKKYLLDNPVPVTTSRRFEIDKKDRMVLKRLCKELDAEFTESDGHLNVITWGKRFIFRVLGGIEFVAEVETIKLV